MAFSHPQLLMSQPHLKQTASHEGLLESHVLQLLLSEWTPTHHLSLRAIFLYPCSSQRCCLHLLGVWLERFLLFESRAIRDCKHIVLISLDVLSIKPHS